jgi:hypothetical protein
MTVMDKFRPLLVTGFAILFAFALWFRVSSLGAFPWHDGDESYYGLQSARMLQGEPFELRTFNRNILNPYLVALQSPFHLVARPSVWVLRAPAAVCGVLAVVLTYVIGARVLDRTTALVAATLLATLPCAVYHSRVGLEMSQLPLSGLVVIAFALRGHGPGLLLSFLASMLVYPPVIFLIPIALPIFLVQLARKGEGDPISRRRVLIGSAIASLVVVATVSALLLGHPMAQIYLKRRPPLYWGHFLDGYERVLFLLYVPFSITNVRMHRLIFRGLLVALLVLGTWRLLRERRWERLALIAGLVASLVGFHLVVGPEMLRVHATHRYGVVFVTPTVLAFACLIRCLSPTRSPEAEVSTRSAFRRVPLAIAIVLGGTLLLCTYRNYFGPVAQDLRESLWTFRPESKDEFDRALSLIRRDSARMRASRNSAVIEAAGGATPTPIVVHDYWAFMPLAYLSSFSKDIEVAELISKEESGRSPIDDLFREKQRVLTDRLRSGAYVVGRIGVPIVWGEATIDDTLRSAFPPGQLRRWEISTRSGGTALIVYRLEDSPPRVATTRPTPAEDASRVRR